MSNRSFAINKDNTSRKKWGSSASGQGRGTNDRLLIGKVKIAGTWRRVRSFIKFDYDWSGVEVVTDATLTLTTADNDSNDSERAPGDGARVAVRRLTKGFGKGTQGNWKASDFTWPPFNKTLKRSGNGSSLIDTTITIDMMKLLWLHAPARVRFAGLGKGQGKSNYGFVLLGDPEHDNGASTEVWSQDYSIAAKRPTLDIVYEQVNVQPTAAVTAPSGNVTADFEFNGSFSDSNANDYMTQVRVQVRKKSASDWSNKLVNVLWSTSVSAVDDLWHVENGYFDKSRLRKGITYQVRAMVWDRKMKSSEWSATKDFTITSDAPTVTAEDFGSIATLDGVLLGGETTVDSLTELLTVDTRVYSGSTLLWDYSRPARYDEQDNQVVTQEYGGPTLDSGSYTYQVRVTDKLGGTSTWDVGSFTLTQDAPDDEADLTNVTGYSPVAPATRIVLLSMDSKSRGPKDVVGIIEDASNIGVSWYASAPGEIYFTLPTTHPQVSVCDPLVTHYRFEQYRRGRWRLLSAGLLHDFHARDTEMIVYGIDYLGLLAWSIEAAKQPSTNYKKGMPTKPKQLVGSRYFKKTIKQIIKDQLHRARNQDSNSPVKFIQTGALGDFSTRITIYASYVQRLEFIRGLIESHKGAITTGGGERRSRIRVRWNQVKNRWQFDALDNVGSDRDNIKLAYGSLLQGYEVRAMGDYANLIYAAGKEPNKVKPQFARNSAPGINQSDWGSIGRSAFWSDITDHKDLQRRARAEAIRASRVGKQIALGLRVQGLAMWDGYDILDNIPIEIDDGVVDTSQYGSGYWTIWGGEYRVYDDGHDEVTLIVRPKGDGATIDTDLIDSDPIHAHSDWKWGSGVPTG